MIDVKTPLRTAYYQLLNGNLSYSSNDVPVSDDVTKLGVNPLLYVLLTQQNGVDKNNFQGFSSDEDIQLEIVYKSTGRVNKEALDNIAGQIFALVQPTPKTCGLVQQAGCNITCVNKIQDRDLSMTLGKTSSIGRRIIIYRQKISQT